MKKTVIFLIFFCSGIISQAQDITGPWNGVLSNLRFVFHINKTEEGYISTMDSIDEGITEIPVATTIFDGSKLSLLVKHIGLTYEGELKTDSIVGTLKQGMLSVPMTLKKGLIEKPKDEIVLKTPTGNIIGTLLAPENDSKDIIALFICGSGPTDRNGNPPQMPNNSIKFLAEDLCSAEIPSVRYDKRGIAASTASGGKEEDLRFSHHVDDARAWIDILTKEYKRVVVIGHSEGALIGFLASIDNPNVAAVVSIAGAGRKFDDVIKAQLADQSQTLLEMAEPIIQNLKNGKTMSDVPPILASLFRPSIQPYLISMLAIDPTTEIAKIIVPVLIIQGDTDFQILKEDAVLLHKAQPKAKMIIIPNMNHVLKECTNTNRIIQMQTTYMNPNLKNIPTLSSEIIEFIGTIKKPVKVGNNSAKVRKK